MDHNAKIELADAYLNWLTVAKAQIRNGQPNLNLIDANIIDANNRLRRAVDATQEPVDFQSPNYDEEMEEIRKAFNLYVDRERIRNPELNRDRLVENLFGKFPSQATEEYMWIVYEHLTNNHAIREIVALDADIILPILIEQASDETKNNIRGYLMNWYLDYVVDQETRDAMEK